MKEKVYAVKARFLVFGVAFVAAKNELEAKRKAARGNVGRVDFEEHTAEVETIESVEEAE